MIVEMLAVNGNKGPLNFCFLFHVCMNYAMDGIDLFYYRLKQDWDYQIIRYNSKL